MTVDYQNTNFNCLICGSPLEYLLLNEEMTCYYCGKKFSANVRCNQGHYVCDACHAKDAYGVITSYLLTTKQNDPMLMAEDLMKHPAVKMHGPEHHYLVPAVLVTAYCHVAGRMGELEHLLNETAKRASIVPGGFCGFYGSCGAGIGTGIYMSIVTGATPLKIEEWQHANLMTSKSLNDIALAGGPRCCKRNVMLALKAAVKFTWDKLAINIPANGTFICHYQSSNRECLGINCLFFPTKKSI